MKETQPITLWASCILCSQYLSFTLEISSGEIFSTFWHISDVSISTMEFLLLSNVHVFFPYPNCLRKESANKTSLESTDLDCTSTMTGRQVMRGCPHPQAGTCRTLEHSKPWEWKNITCWGFEIAVGLRSPALKLGAYCYHPESPFKVFPTKWSTASTNEDSILSFSCSHVRIILRGS